MNYLSAQSERELDAEQKSLSKTLGLGFATLLALTFLLGGFAVYQLDKVNEILYGIVDNNNNKMKYAYAMRDAIRVRALSLSLMGTSNDVFYRDEELQRFYAYAGKYRIARENLLAMTLNEAEKNIMKKLDMHVKKSQPLNRKAAELLINDELPAEFKDIIRAALFEQSELSKLLETSIALQSNYTESAVTSAKQNLRFIIAVMFAICICTLIIGIVIARLVTGYVARKNRELAEKNFDLAEASKNADQATRAKSDFLASMSHEIRTPLTAIIGYSDILLDPDHDSEETLSAATAINKSGRHLHQLINDVLDMSKIEAGQFEMEYLDSDIQSMVAEVVAMIYDRAKQKGLMLSATYEYPLPKLIYTDPTRLKQILINMCGNAIKFTERGSITIHTSYNQQSNKVSFSIVDTGIGMTQIQAASVFEPFAQADKSTNRKYGGTGLGLAISKHLAERLGGEITCTSEIGSGSKFVVIISAVGNMEDQSKSIELIYSRSKNVERVINNMSTLSNTQFQARVLLAEDNPDNQHLVSLYLKKAGITTVVVENGRLAVDAASNQPFDLILMDMDMPVMDGTTAIRTLRAQGYGKPIVSLTANATQEDRERCYAAGANDFITKPINVSVFQDILNTYLKVRESNNLEHNLLSQQINGEVPAAHNHVAVGRPDTNYHDEFLEIIQGFLANLPTVIADINKSYDKKDWQLLRQQTHRLKGTGGALGFPELTVAAQKLLESAKSQNQIELDLHIAELTELVFHVLEDEKQKKSA